MMTDGSFLSGNQAITLGDALRDIAMQLDSMIVTMIITIIVAELFVSLILPMAIDGLLSFPMFTLFPYSKKIIWLLQRFEGVGRMVSGMAALVILYMAKQQHILTGTHLGILVVVASIYLIVIIASIIGWIRRKEYKNLTFKIDEAETIDEGDGTEWQSLESKAELEQEKHSQEYGILLETLEQEKESSQMSSSKDLQEKNNLE